MKTPIITAFLLASTMAMGQGVLGVGNFIHVVANLDKSIEFYHDAIGLEMTGAPGPHAFSANAVVSSLYDAPGAQSRVASFKIPNSVMAIEIVEFQGLNATPVRPRSFDPGAITLTLPVKDLDGAKTRLHRIQGLAWESAGRDGSALVRDPDGIFVNLVAEIGLVNLGVTVADLRAGMEFYENVLGFDGPSNVPRTTARLAVPGDAFPFNLSDPGYADRKPVHSEIHDPGSGVLRLRVSDFDAIVSALKQAGATVVSAGGQPVSLGRNRAMIFRGKDNLFLQVLESAPAAAKGPAAK
jgi:catechol 2,3-dioxygenase-like lactoylglutathione lyase family enzyme